MAGSNGRYGTAWHPGRAAFRNSMEPLWHQKRIGHPGRCRSARFDW
jgi:hypothetical protein